MKSMLTLVPELTQAINEAIFLLQTLTKINKYNKCTLLTLLKILTTVN